MYVNCGDKDFFERGRLVDSEHSDSVMDILVCNPYSDEEDLYQFGECSVDITDDWIDKQAVMDFLGMDSDSFNPIEYAIGCIDYYGMENFGACNYVYDYTRMTKEDIKDILKYRLIATDNLDIVW